jgi:hypothetical protein
MTRSLQDHPNAVAGRRCRNTAEPSGELSAGDVVAVGEAALAVGRPAGWDPVRGGLNEVRIHDHGTHPLPASAPPRAPGAPRGRSDDGE